MAWHHLLYNDRLLPMLLGKKPLPKLGGERPETFKPYLGQAKMFDARTSSELTKEWPESVAKSPTPNYLKMGSGGWLLWSVRYGTPLEVDGASRWAAELMMREDAEGHWLAEPLACDPHAQFHLAGELAWRIAAMESERREDLAKETVRRLRWLLAVSDRRWRQLRNLWSVLAAPDGQVISCGTRSGVSRPERICTPPANQVATAIYRELERIPQTGVLKGKQWWRDPVWGLGPASVIRDMHAEGDTFGENRSAVALQAAEPFLPSRMRYKLSIIRNQDGHAVWFEGGRQDSEPVCHWLEVEYGRKGNHRVACGFDFEQAYIATREPDVKIGGG